ncbi:hypothetical protein KP004_00650 [Geomonas oryzisoli]|uniref:Ribbon-helix-helix protein CopG domain-containing protein n=1 Tax=Geomonas oryzisoli TaxID=2847992 RepID=A0ABX8J7E0_9BACT|nr:hypothetical protein [Geomonas oryzisoli]QWV93733.1 hypothetical protein KP004_00650 [Geomonas oryzisoli]
MDKISLRLSEEERGMLHGQAEALGISLSELIRERLFAPQGLTVSLRVEELTRQVGTLSEGVLRLAERGENAPSPAPEMPPALGAALERIERFLWDLSQQIGALRETVSEQKAHPTGWTSFLSRSR